MELTALCQDCVTLQPETKRCKKCGSPRLVIHNELTTLTTAHMDCDAFYASVEKRDNPELRDKAVIIGGGKRGVVSTACYIARIKGVRSAMPMFKAMALCPEAVVVKPRMSVYVETSRQIKSMMQELTPGIEPLSLDEAFLDLAGTEKLHGACPAVLLGRLANKIAIEAGVSISIGLSHNKFLAKIASDLNKPRGFSIIGRAETESFLKNKPVSLIWGVGKAFQKTLENDGIRTISDILTRDRKDLSRKYGSMGERLWHLSRGLDNRSIKSRSKMKSISNETTFFDDISDAAALERYLWKLSEKVADRAKEKGISGRIVVLKLKRSNHAGLSRRVTLSEPTQMAGLIFETSQMLLAKALDQGPFRLIGVGLSDLKTAGDSDYSLDLLAPKNNARDAAERATDEIRNKFGKDAIIRGRALR